MSEISITKKDVAWSYISKVLQLASGFITLPLVLHLLSAEEVGMNYLMLTVGSLVSLFDFGFSPQFGRNITYCYSGADRLCKVGLSPNVSGNVNFHLLSVVISTAKFVYRRLSLIVLLIMLSFGSLYIYRVTDGFSNVSHAFLIWLIYSVSTFFNVYFSYYTSLLTGSGMIAESCKASLLGRISYLLICIGLLLAGCGLFSIVISNLIAPFIQRFYCYKVYYTSKLRANLDVEISKSEIKETFQIIWYNAKKLGITFLGAFVITKFGMFIIGFYLPITVIGSYGLLMQLSTILVGFASSLFYTYEPRFSNFRVNNQLYELKSLFSFVILVFWVVMILGSLVIFFGGDTILSLIKSKTMLPSKWVCGVYLVSVILENNHSQFASLIITKNEVPIVPSSLISGLFILILTFVSLQFTSLGLLGVVLVPFFVQLSYNNWRWPLFIFKDLNYNIKEFFSLGFAKSESVISNLYAKYI